jgi:AcrR family transcriptional regulator
MAKSLPMGQIPSRDLSKGVLASTVPRDTVDRPQRQRILDAMAANCAEKTYAATTISDIVSKAGVSRATFYKLFGDKRRCFDAAVGYFVGEVRAAGTAASSDAATNPENVRAEIAAVLELLAAEPAYTRLVVIEAVAVDPDLVKRFRSLLIEGLRYAHRGSGMDLSDSAIRTAFGQAQVLIANQILTGQEDTLLDLLPDLVYIALHPFSGPEEALKQAQLAR